MKKANRRADPFDPSLASEAPTGKHIRDKPWVEASLQSGDITRVVRKLDKARIDAQGYCTRAIWRATTHATDDHVCMK